MSGVAAAVAFGGAGLVASAAGFGGATTSAVALAGRFGGLGLRASMWGVARRTASAVSLRVSSANTTGSVFGRNPFAGKSAAEVDALLRARGFKAVGPDPAAGRGAYFHPVTGRKYYLDPGGIYRAGRELPHVDVHRMRDGVNVEGLKRKYPLGESLYE